MQFIPAAIKGYYRNLLHIAVTQNGLALKYVPKENINHLICVKAVKQNGLSLRYVPPEFAKSPRVLLEAVAQNGKAFEWVVDLVDPKTKLYKRLYWIAISQYPQAVLSILKHLRTPELYRQAAKVAIAKNPFSLFSIELEEMWPYLRTPELMLQAVKQNGIVLRDLPEYLQIPPILFAAISQNGLALQYVSQEWREEEFYELLCLIAVEKNGMALQYVPKEKISVELCRKAVNQNPKALQFVPEEKQIWDLCREAVMKDPLVLQWVAHKLKTLPLCLEAVLRNGASLRFVPWELQTQQPHLQLIALLQNANAIEIIRELDDRFDRGEELYPSAKRVVANFWKYLKKILK